MKKHKTKPQCPVSLGSSVMTFQMEPGRLWSKAFVEQMGFKSGANSWWGYRWWE